MIFETQVEVRYPDTDQMGIVHHAVYPLWFEIARFHLFDTLGVPRSVTQPLGIDPAMVSLDIRYHAPTRFPDTVTVKTKILFTAAKKIRFRYEVYDGSGALTVDAESFHIWTGPDMHSLNIAEALPVLYEAVTAACEPEAENA